MRPVINRPACLDLATNDENGCLVSSTFSAYAQSLLGNTEPQESFVVCDYLGDIQQELFNASLGTNTTFENLVVVPENLTSKLVLIYGNETEFTGRFLLDNFGGLSLRRLFDFISLSLTSTDVQSERRLKARSQASQTVKRGSVMMAVKEVVAPLGFNHRMLESGNPLVEIPVNSLLTLTFDFNFGNGDKQ